MLDLIDSVCKVALSSLKIADLTHRPSRLSKADVETVPCYKRDLVMSMYVLSSAFMKHHYSICLACYEKIRWPRFLLPSSICMSNHAC